MQESRYKYGSIYVSFHFFGSFYFRKSKKILSSLRKTFMWLPSVEIKKFIKMESHPEMEFYLDSESG